MILLNCIFYNLLASINRMKHIKKSIYILLFALGPTFAIAGSLCGKATTDSALLSCSAKEFATADKKLNEVYGKLLKVLDAKGQHKLREAQRAWVSFRDLNAEFSGDINRGGSAEALNIVGAKTSMTDERVKELQNEFELRK